MKYIASIFLCIAMWCSTSACGQTSAGYRNLEVSEFRDEINSKPSVYLLDMRTPEEFNSGHIEGAHNLDWRNPAGFREGVASLPKDSTIYVYCRSGVRSASAAEYLTKEGFKVVNLLGGINQWNNR